MLSAVAPEITLSVISRWIHILAIAVVVGGTFLIRQVVWPAAASLREAGGGEQLREQVQVRWRRIVHVAVALIIVTGFYNFYVAVAVYGRTGAYHMVFGVKFLAAIALIFIAIALTSRGEAFAPFRRRAGTWMGVNLLLAVVIILLSSVLKHADKLLGGPA